MRGRTIGGFAWSFAVMERIAHRIAENVPTAKTLFHGMGELEEQEWQFPEALRHRPAGTLSAEPLLPPPR